MYKLHFQYSLLRLSTPPMGESHDSPTQKVILVRSRLVARDFKGGDKGRDDLFADTPQRPVRRTIMASPPVHSLCLSVTKTRAIKQCNLRARSLST